jgi:proton-dependent oligopeptide transporter, POT family
VSMAGRTPFPRVFWVANVIEVLERFAYYGIYFGFGIYMASLGYSRSQLGIVQSIFLFLSYGIPVVSGSFSDRFGFKKVLIVSYLAYLPSILLLIATRSFSGIALTMLSIGLAAGIFKPLIAGTVRATTDTTNKSLGFGIYYQMVNVGGTFGPIIMGNLRAVSWNAAFLAAAAIIVVMLLITIFFYKEPPRESENIPLAGRLKEIGVALSDLRFALFLILLGIVFWLPFWCFFNICSLYVDSNLDTARLYVEMRSVLGETVAGYFSAAGKDGVTRILGETVSTTGLVIMIFQSMVSWLFERRRALPSFLFGLSVIVAGFLFLGYARIGAPGFVFLGVLLFAVGEMIASPRIQEYITWIAPKDKAGLYTGMNFLAVMLGGALSGVTYTALYGTFDDQGRPEYIWFTLAAHLAIGIAILMLFLRTAGEFKEQEK